MTASRRAILSLCTLTLTALVSTSGWAQADYPARPIKLIVPFSAGSASDTVARAVADEMGRQIPVPVVVENREGAGGNIGNTAVARSAPDGYTVLMGTSLMTMSVHMNAPPAYDAVKDFVPIARIGTIPLVAVASTGAPFKTWSELVAYAKANAGKINYASSNKGSSSHVYTEMLKREFGFDAQEVPYKNLGQAVTDTATGINHFFIANLPPTRGLIQAGQLRPLAVGSRQRLAAFPEVPTFAELTGRADLELALWYGFFVPAGTPPPVVARLNREIIKAAETPAVRARLESNGGALAIGTGAELGALVQSDNQRFRTLMKDLDLVPTAAK